MFELKVDIINRDCGFLVQTGTKVFRPTNNPLTNWIKRPRNTEPALPMVSWYPKLNGNIHLDKQSPNSLGFLHFNSNNIQQSVRQVSLLSGPHNAGNGWSITPELFHKSMICFGLRKLAKHGWCNDIDQFDIPNIQHPEYEKFSYDVVVFALFNNANYTSSLHPVTYKDNTFELRNNFFWMTPEEFKNIKGMPPKIVQDAIRSKTPYTAQWLEDNKDNFSEDAKEIITLAKQMVIASASKRLSGNPEHQLDRWDAGRYQIWNLYKSKTFKMTEEMEGVAEKMEKAYKALRNRLRPIMYELGVLPKEQELE